MVAGMAVEVTSRDELEDWLRDKPSSWVNVLSQRLAFWTAPLALDPAHWKSRGFNPRILGLLWRGLVPLYLINERETLASELSLSRFLYDAAESLDALHDEMFNSADSDQIENVIASISNCLDINSGFQINKERDEVFVFLLSVDNLREYGYDYFYAVSRDISELEAGRPPSQLCRMPLWGQSFDQTNGNLRRARQSLANDEIHFQHWFEWYDRRVRGLATAFEGFTKSDDIEFYQFLSDQPKEWWDQDPFALSAAIATKADELRQPGLPSASELRQDERAVTFEVQEDGAVGLASQRNSSEVDHSEDAQERHREALTDALAALDASRPGVTQATDVEQPLKRYIDALGEDTFGISHALLIARGEKLRRLIAQREDDLNFAVPFSSEQSGRLADWLTAHNLLVGLDPFLSSVERISKGPDAVPTVLDLEALKAVIISAEAQEIPDVEAASALDDLAENVPSTATPNDRRLRQATEGLKNFVRGIGALIKKHGWKLGAGGGLVAERAYAAAEWVQRNIEWLREVFANEPSILSILEKIAALPL